MEPRRLSIVIFISVTCFTLLMLAGAYKHHQADQLELSRGAISQSTGTTPSEMPPGYSLQVDQFGEYRPIEDEGNRPLFWIEGPGTKQEAIDRAWQQYLHREKEKSRVWEKVE